VLRPGCLLSYGKPTAVGSEVVVKVVNYFYGSWQCSAIAERPRCRVRYWPKVERWNWETKFCGHYKSVFNHCDIGLISLKIYRIRWKKRKIRAIRAFKVIEVGTNRRPVCDFLLVINSNWHPISYRFRVITAYRSNFGHFAFLSHPLGGGA